MWEKIRVVFTIPELRKKILFTLGLLAVYRVGWQIPLPIIDQSQMTAFFKSSTGMGQLFQHVAVFSAAQLNQITIFGLGIMPYISASIIFQLLGSVWGPLERLQKEGESGRKKINEYTRYATVVLCIGQSWAYLGFLVKSNLVLDSFLVNGTLSFGWQLVTVMTMTAGTIFLMWLGEQIDEFGIGNGISLIIMAGILAGMPGAGYKLISDSSFELGSGSGKLGLEVLILLMVLFVAVVAGVVFITLGQRRIPTQSAKHVRGRRVYGGTRQYLPLRVNQAGVMPIIFASSLLMFPLDYFHATCQGVSQRGFGRLGRSLWQSPRLVRLQRAVHRFDLLLLLFLDRHHLQSEGHGGKPQELRHVHSRLSAGQADGRLLGKGDGAHHVRGGRVFGTGGNHADGDRGCFLRGLSGGQLFRRHRLADRRQRGLRSGAENRQPPGDAELSGLAGKILTSLSHRSWADLRGPFPGETNMRIVFIGPPGVGKGTQSERLVKHLGILHLSTGDMLRQAWQERSDLGRLAQQHMDQGELVPDPLILELVGERLEQGDCQPGYLLDGFPRTLGQAQGLDELLRRRATPLTAILALEADEDELIKRLAGRGRADDRPEVVRNRLEAYARKTAPLIDYYRGRGLLHTIDGVGTPDEVFARIKAVFDPIVHKPGR